jgi:hypothetical protein
MIDQKMLLGTAEKRWKVKTVCVKLRRIFAQSQARPREHVPQEIMDAVFAVDQAAPSKATRPELLEEQSDARQIRKSKHLDLPLMKTPYHFQGRKSALSPPVLETEEPLQAISEKPPSRWVFSVLEKEMTVVPQFPNPFPKERMQRGLAGQRPHAVLVSWSGLLQGIASVV